MTQLSLVIPGLCGPLPETDRLDNEAVKSLVHSLSKAQRSTLSQQGFHDVLAMLFAIEDSKPFPAAALSLLASGQYTEQGQWFHATPIYLQADIDHAILRDTHGLDLTLEESKLLVDELNAHFSDCAIRFVINDKDNWFINVNGHEKISTTPVHDVISRNVYTFMPRGEDALFWKKIMNEVQMLLHQSPVNEQRSNDGRLPVNGAWFWGEGKLPEAEKVQAMEVYSRNPVTKGLAALSNLNCYPVSRAEEFFEGVSGMSNNVLVLDELFNVTSYGDVAAWQASFNDLYENWLQPIFHWMKKNRVKVTLYPCNGVCYQMMGKKRFSLFRDKRIGSYIDSYE